MKTLATLEADLWLANRNHRRTPSDETLKKIQDLQAEVDSLKSEIISEAKAPIHTNPKEKEQKKEKAVAKPKDDKGADNQKKTKQTDSEAK